MNVRKHGTSRSLVGAGDVSGRSTKRNSDIALRLAAWLYLVGLIAHTADHIRRGTSVVTTEVLALGVLSTIAGIVTVALIFTRNHRAPLVAAVFGFQVAIGVAVVHLLPKWSAFSDAFLGSRGTGISAMSWTVVLIEIAGGLALGIAGASAVSRERRTDYRLTQAAITQG
jgi:hypothetical protein